MGLYCIVKDSHVYRVLPFLWLLISQHQTGKHNLRNEHGFIFTFFLQEHFLSTTLYCYADQTTNFSHYMLKNCTFTFSCRYFA